LALVSCRPDRAPQASQASGDTAPAGSPPAASAVTITTSDFAFDAPAEIPAGLTTFHLVNRGPSPHHVQLIKLEQGKTVEDYMAALKAGGPPPQWGVPAGGPNPPEVGDTATTIMPLAAGNYAMLCFIPTPDGVPHMAKGMVRALTVTPAAGTAAAEPQADIVMTLKDYDFELSKPLAAGRYTIRIENAGPQPHEVAFVRLKDKKKPIDFAEWGEKQVGPAPGTLHGGVSAIMPGTSAFVNVDLPPGEYGLICFLPDMKDGKGHFHHGMIKQVKVG
jgi:hypothetical protein